MDGGQTAQLIYLALLLASVGAWALVEFRSRLGQAARMALAWGLIVVALMAGYGLWEGLQRDQARQGQIRQGEVVEILRQDDGHFYLTVKIGDQDIDFMVDTGASDIVLTGRDAQAIGIDPQDLVFDGRAMTANGEVRTASIRLPFAALEGHVLTDLPAVVNEGQMEQSLLGMAFLRHFDMKMSGDYLMLAPR